MNPQSSSKYAQVWAILKAYKTVALTLDTPRVERTVRKAIIEHKKLDKNKNNLERIKVTRALVEGKIQLTFHLVPTVRARDEYFDLTGTVLVKETPAPKTLDDFL